MDILKASLVKATAGHDKGEVFFVLGVTENRVILADGKKRRIANPKQKNLRHVQQVSVGDEQLRHKTNLSDREIRKTLAEYRAGSSKDRGGC